jgi:CRISPR system Cascade subunit CasC
MAFLQLHTLTAYPANNLNRDDLGRPKSMVFGGTQRLRLSSQSLKRAWRLSDAMQESFNGDNGVRTRELWTNLADRLHVEGHPRDTVVTHLVPIKQAFEGSSKKKKEEAASDESQNNASRLLVENPDEDVADDPQEDKKDKNSSKKRGRNAKEQEAEPKDPLKSNLYFYSRSEREFIEKLVRESLKAGEPLTEKHVLNQILPEQRGSDFVLALRMSPDVAMFGRMVAGRNALAIEGAVQVAHSFTTDKAALEDDFFAAVDDMKSDSDDAVTGHIDANGFGCGLYYSYVNVHVETLLKNLSGDKAQAAKIVAALIESVATIAPTGKQNSFTAHSYATYMMAELGKAQPRSFADAFVRAVRAEDLRGAAVDRLQKERESLMHAFPHQRTEAVEMNRLTREGDLTQLQELARKAFV